MNRSATKARLAVGAILVVAILVLAGCGGGSSASVAAGNADSAASNGTSTAGTGSSSGNVATVTVDGGTDGSAANEPFVTVTLCQPGTATCRSIDHVLLDTGSSGLRVLASALQDVALPAIPAPSGGAIAECLGFASGYSWGSVRRADVKISGEVAAGVPVQVVNDTTNPYGVVPASCRNQGNNMGAGAAANGILGVGMLVQDCGAGCVTNAQSGIYYTCANSNQCSASTAPLSSQVLNPVTAFPSDNNGLAIALPAVSPPGAAVVSGTVTFGLATQANNALGAAGIYTTDASGLLTTTYKGAQMSAFLDTGSNGYFFHDATIRLCSSGFYCPSSTLQLQAQLTGLNGASSAIEFTIEASTAVTPGITAAPIGGDASLPRTFDWGLPFFFGRTVYVAFDGTSTPAGTGPFWAF